MSKKIEEILLIMRVMKDELKNIQPISSRRQRAVRIVAELYKITPQAIMDKYTRKLGINTAQFDDLLTKLFEKKDSELLRLLRKHGDRDDQVAIDEFEKEFLAPPPPPVKLAPSILSADFACLGQQVAEATEAGASYIHIDVMDGRFVPNITIGAPVVAAIRRSTNLPLDVHLMIEAPEHQITRFAEAGANIITVHIEVCPHILRTVQMIKGAGVMAGVALNPGTPLDSLAEILPELDLVLVMTVDPGFGGQPFIAGMLDKIARLRAKLDVMGLATELEVDGGINAEIAPQVVRAGARVLVAGTAIFSSGKSVKEAFRQLQNSLSRK